VRSDGLTTDERKELYQLRCEVRTLREERDTIDTCINKDLS
jgi:hypothetical protein